MLQARTWSGLPRSGVDGLPEGICGVVTLSGATKFPIMKDVLGGEFCLLQVADTQIKAGTHSALLLLRSQQGTETLRGVPLAMLPDLLRLAAKDLGADGVLAAQHNYGRDSYLYKYSPHVQGAQHTKHRHAMFSEES